MFDEVASAGPDTAALVYLFRLGLQFNGDNLRALPGFRAARPFVFGMSRGRLLSRKPSTRRRDGRAASARPTHQ